VPPPSLLESRAPAKKWPRSKIRGSFNDVMNTQTVSNANTGSEITKNHAKSSETEAIAPKTAKLPPTIAERIVLNAERKRTMAGLVDVAQATARLAIAKSTFLKHVCLLGITPAYVDQTRSGQPKFYFSPAQVEEVARHRALSIKDKRRLRARHESTTSRAEMEEGEGAARAFEAFDRGLDPRRAVIALKMSPSIVHYLYQQWARLGEGVMLTKEQTRAIEAFPWGDGAMTRIEDGAALVEGVRKFFVKMTAKS
jgi:hypothetical protein